MRSFVEGRKSQPCVAYYIKYSINLLYVFVEGVVLDFQTCMQCFWEKLITNTLLTLELDPRVSLAPKTPFPFPFKRLPLRLPPVWILINLVAQLLFSLLISKRVSRSDDVTRPKNINRPLQLLYFDVGCK